LFDTGRADKLQVSW
jgi:hypothetical protein